MLCYVRRWPEFEPVPGIHCRDDDEWWFMQELPAFPGAPTTELTTLPEWRRTMRSYIRALRFCIRRATSRYLRVDHAAREWYHVTPRRISCAMRDRLVCASFHWHHSRDHLRRMAECAWQWLALGSALGEQLNFVFKDTVDAEWALAIEQDRIAAAWEENAEEFLASYEGPTHTSSESDTDSEQGTGEFPVPPR